jgi:hypothetical protein
VATTGGEATVPVESPQTIRVRERDRGRGPNAAVSPELYAGLLLLLAGATQLFLFVFRYDGLARLGIG